VLRSTFASPSTAPPRILPRRPPPQLLPNRAPPSAAARPCATFQLRGGSLRPSQAELLRRHGLRLNKALGQHFLVDQRVLDRIEAVVCAEAPDRVVELGAGAGALTFRLLDAGLAVRALEIDPRMVELLRTEAADAPLEVVECDLARADFRDHLRGRTLFVGNLPYQVTSPVLFGLMPALRELQVLGAVLMMQREVAQRLVASPGGRDYGILSVLAQAEWMVERLLVVRPGSFLPPPAVDSAVVRARPRADRVDLGPRGTELVKTLFQQRRKQIGGLLRRAYGIAPERLEALAAETGLEPQARAEDLALEDFVRLDRWLGDDA